MNPSLSTQSSSELPRPGSALALASTPAAQDFDEPRTRSLLAGNPQQITDALALIEQHLHHSLTRWLMQRQPGLTAQDLDDVWSETLLAVLKAARAGRFKSDRPLLPWLCHIARSRAIDHLRLCASWSHLRQRLERRAATTQDRPVESSSAEDILQLLRDFLATLPPQQKTVMDVFLEQLPERPPLTDLQQEVIRRSGHDTTLMAVKRSLQAGRQKFSHHLRQRGYELPAGIPWHRMR